MKKLILGFFLLAGVETNAQTRPMAILQNSLTSNRTLTTDSCYVLRGVYVVDNNAVLTMDPGVEILCEAASSLVVTQGSKLFSNGTSALPVVFSPMQDPGLRTPGFWVGLLVNGEALTNVTGGISKIKRGSVDYSGGGVLDNDNSGSITLYPNPLCRRNWLPRRPGTTRIGTQWSWHISNVQVAYSATDSMALLGGKVNVSNAYVLNAYRAYF